MRVFRFRYDDWVKCNGCRWPVENLYVLADDEAEATKLLERGDAGLCGDCLSEMLSDCGYQVVLNE
ncbi:MAG: hypothetical protein QXS50_04080 [Candidatus Caldarchaeum sp.]